MNYLVRVSYGPTTGAARDFTCRKAKYAQQKAKKIPGIRTLCPFCHCTTGLLASEKKIQDDLYKRRWLCSVCDRAFISLATAPIALG